MSDWFETLNQRIADSRKRLNALPEGSFEYVTGGSSYAQKAALWVFHNDEAADPDVINDFDLMVMYDGNPCFGGSVKRLPKSEVYPHGAARITVYTD